MSGLHGNPVLLLDCQTTGMRPSSAKILEIGWCIFANGRAGPIQTRMLSLSEGDVLPQRIREITGISDEDLKAACAESDVLGELRDVISGWDGPVRVVAHYAQFERAFVEDALARLGVSLRLEWICSQRIAKRMFPEVPSQNLRAMAGFFGSQLPELKRAGENVRATIEVWKAILSRSEEAGIRDWPTLSSFLKQKAPVAKPYNYRIEKLQRLSLPDKPGVYRMLARDGKILYVGKATSLRSRVNSYFRGQKGRDRRKLEMLAQVWDLKVTECESPLEAALLETDEIKKWDPPYNVSLKDNGRSLVFYSRDFVSASECQTSDTPLGPFRQGNILESFRMLQDWLMSGELGLIFYQEIDPDLMNEGFDIFCAKRGLSRATVSRGSLRSLLALGMRELRQFLKSHDDDLETIFARRKREKADEELTADGVAGKFERLFLRSAACLRRCRQLTRLMNCEVLVKTKFGERRFAFANGQLTGVLGPRSKKQMTMADYDRMSVLLSEIEKHGCEVQS